MLSHTFYYKTHSIRWVPSNIILHIQTKKIEVVNSVPTAGMYGSHTQPCRVISYATWLRHLLKQKKTTTIAEPFSWLTRAFCFCCEAKKEKLQHYLDYTLLTVRAQRVDFYYLLLARRSFHSNHALCIMQHEHRKTVQHVNVLQLIEPLLTEY